MTMLQKFKIITYVFLFGFCPPGAGQASDGRADFDGALIGTWKGDGKIIVNWCNRKTLSFELLIDSHGNVSGKIGDADIHRGKMEPNRMIYRWLGNREYVIQAELSGHLVKKEAIQRNSIRVFLDFENPDLVGGFHSSGSKFGGKKKMILSGLSVKLTKIPTQTVKPD